ncbi:hypothetical protein [Klebsiella aerogenes]|uniref:hypothetical protein n=1 Tax=Klebsiella aerogenes TaxID=548 RepID=UPI0034D233DB
MNDDENYIDGDEALVRALHVFDDGRDWSAWLVWNMNSRRRISEHRFELPPARPQIRPPSIIPKKKARKPSRQKVKLESDF